jgi:hypothetical protein
MFQDGSVLISCLMFDFNNNVLSGLRIYPSAEMNTGCTKSIVTHMHVRWRCTPRPAYRSGLASLRRANEDAGAKQTNWSRIHLDREESLVRR